MLGFFLIIGGGIMLTAGILMVAQVPKASGQNLEDAIALAMVDGQLTPKEESMIRELAKHQGVEVDPLIEKLRADLATSSEESETTLVDIQQKAGLDFEKYVVKKFDKEYFTLKQWAGDKYTEGRYAETTQQPDLQLELRLKGNSYALAVECKWRKQTEGDFIRFAKDEQWKRYQEFQDTSGTPTFIALGVGGLPYSPDALYVIPVEAFRKPIQHKANLQKYWKSPESNFFFDAEKVVLR